MPFVIVPTPPSSVSYIPYTPEISIPYTLTGPDGTIAAFNDQTNPNWVGNLADITGLDSPDIRESADVLVQTDGGWHGNFWYGRRPITMSGQVFNMPDSTIRAARLDTIRRACNALQQDAILSWLPSNTNAVQMQTWVRRQQPVRFTGGWAKQFQILLVSQFAPLFSQALHTPVTTGTITITNYGNYGSYPILRIDGPTTNPVITNQTTGAFFQFLSFSLASGQYAVIDVLNRTATQGASTNINANIDFLNSTWPTVSAGNSTWHISGGGQLTITYRDAWI